MKKKQRRFDAKLTDEEREALEKLAEREKVTMSGWFKKRIQRSAKRLGLWN